MSQFIPGDIVASKSGTQYRVVFNDRGRLGVSPMSGKGSFRNMNEANATMVTPAERPAPEAPVTVEETPAPAADFNHGDLVSTKSGIHYRVTTPASPREGKTFVRAIVQTRGSGWRWLATSGLTLVEAAADRQVPGREERRETAIQEAQEETPAPATDVVTEVPAGASKLFRGVVTLALASGLDITMRQSSPTFISVTVMDPYAWGGWLQLCQGVPEAGQRARHYASQSYTLGGSPVDLKVRHVVAAVNEMADRKARRDATRRDATGVGPALTDQQEAMADMYGPTVEEPAEPARVLSPMDRERQVRRIAAEIRGAQPEQRWESHALAAALYDAGVRITDPGSPS